MAPKGKEKAVSAKGDEGQSRLAPFSLVLLPPSLGREAKSTDSKIQTTIPFALV